MELTDDVMNQVLRDVSKNISKERKKKGTIHGKVGRNVKFVGKSYF